MLRNRIQAPLAAAALAAASFTAGQVQNPPRIDPVQMEMQAAIAELDGRIEFLETFVESQADAGEALDKAVKDAETMGFTAGINPESRVALLKGLRAQAESLKSGKSEAEGDEAPKSGRRSERGKRRSR